MQKTVLIVEDETDLRDPIADYLQEAGYTVVTAANGQQGLQCALQRHPDIILLDLMMPVMDGHEMLKRLREDTWGSTVKVIIMSAMDDVHNIGSAYEGGITEYVIKGQQSLSELAKKVREVLFANT